ncbi:MAG TPA: polysaccharide biosynthesis/export family protein [Terriglobales bacterium]|nr:polysaccharide biosynthesis/export family protein [Terriglobales bacterium]
MKITTLLATVLLAGSSAVSYAQATPLSQHTSVTPTPSGATSAPQLSERNPRYVLRPGDVLDVNFELSPELNQEVSIQPDGFVTLKQIGDLHVSGKSVPEFRETLKQEYSRFLHDPMITVLLKDFEKPYFTAGGMVGHPGKYEIRGDVTLVEALQQAGGLTSESKHSQVLLFRRVSQDWLQAKVIDVKKMINQKDLTEDLHLQPGDMIFVPQNRISKIRQFIPTAGFNMASPVL